MDRNIFYWNVRGACGPNFYQNIKLACSRNNPCLVVLSETKCERVEKLQCVSKLGFDGTTCVPSVGRSGGLFAAWKSDQIRVEIIHQGRQLFHFRCRFPGGCFFFVTAVYAIPDSHHKQLLWSELRSFASSMVEPWAVIGDFNDIAFSTERTGGLSSHPNRYTIFSDRMRDCNLIDLGAVGPKFTWKGPKLRGQGRLFERLDRVIANEDFISTFTDCSADEITAVEGLERNCMHLLTSLEVGDGVLTAAVVRFHLALAGIEGWSWLDKVGIPEFLNGIGNGVESHVAKLETEIGDFQKLLDCRTLKLKKLGIPCKHRKLILKYAHKYRLGLWRPRADLIKT
ncbi:hypothetical protein K1719_046541 [Acacia pycnantha]|nr:hypothetical protein K1719_046541 [Acacia pycnantha]